MKFVAAFSWAMARIGLTVMFVTVFVVYAVVLRIVGKDPLQRRIDPEEETYWKETSIEIGDIETFEKLY